MTTAQFTRGAVRMQMMESVGAASRLMRERDLGSVVVVEDTRGAQPVGILTDRDVAHAVAEGLDLERMPIGNLVRIELPKAAPASPGS